MEFVCDFCEEDILSNRYRLVEKENLENLVDLCDKCYFNEETQERLKKEFIFKKEYKKGEGEAIDYFDYFYDLNLDFVLSKGFYAFKIVKINIVNGFEMENLYSCSIKELKEIGSNLQISYENFIEREEFIENIVKFQKSEKYDILASSKDLGFENEQNGVINVSLDVIKNLYNYIITKKKQFGTYNQEDNNDYCNNESEDGKIVGDLIGVCFSTKEWFVEEGLKELILSSEFYNEHNEEREKLNFNQFNNIIAQSFSNLEIPDLISNITKNEIYQCFCTIFGYNNISPNEDYINSSGINEDNIDWETIAIKWLDDIQNAIQQINDNVRLEESNVEEYNNYLESDVLIHFQVIDDTNDEYKLLVQICPASNGWICEKYYFIKNNSSSSSSSNNNNEDNMEID
eukprot:TRINITY_DN1264_c0_g1_i1.p1 TRINITY_DN1264_c0_g1~~TRINITY_DN1264_c0_g1_i1.p1  ORF type:complete len:402 (+),score=116.49 TRINITY_DN1264_c0_g1_i1:49-1254(+)